MSERLQYSIALLLVRGLLMLLVKNSQYSLAKYAGQSVAVIDELEERIKTIDQQQKL